MAEAEDGTHLETTIAYNVIACIIFAFMSSCLFFPNNDYIPLDRRTASCIAGTLCYVTRNFFFPKNKLDVEEAVDFDVLLLLAAIMCINYIIVNQKETKAVVEYVQHQIRDKPRNGFWLVAFSAFLASPFLTNDGVCLLFVEPILNAFTEITDDEDDKKKSGDEIADKEEEEFDGAGDFKLHKKDALYFLLGLACSSNIGSSLTYTGNPQVKRG
jgi:Na+/H+ antiporter NhaD/arsenite permease-like protein